MEMSSNITFGAAGAESTAQSSHNAFASVRFSPDDRLTRSSEHAFVPGVAAVERRLVNENRQPPINSPVQLHFPLSRAVHTHASATSVRPSCHPQDADVAETAGWNCSFCWMQRRAEDAARAYTSLLVKRQQEVQDDTRLSQRQKHNSKHQQQQGHHQQFMHEKYPQRERQLAIQQQHRQLEQHVEQLPFEQEAPKEDGVDHHFAALRGEQSGDTPHEATPESVQSCTAASSSGSSYNRGKGCEQRGRICMPTSTAANFEEATETARAYVCHLTIHREDERSPSPRRVAADFVARKYAQKLQEREERLVHAALTAASEYTGSLYRDPTARLQQAEVAGNPATLHVAIETAKKLAHIRGDDSCARSDPDLQAGTGSQPPPQKQQQESTSAEETSSVLRTALQPTLSGCTDTDVKLMLTEPDPQDRSGVAVACDKCGASASPNAEDVAQARNVESPLKPETHRQESVCPAVAAAGSVAEPADSELTAVECAHKESKQTCSDRSRVERCASPSTKVGSTIPEAHGRAERRSAAPQTIGATTVSSAALEPSRKQTVQAITSVLPTRKWLDERERLHVE